MCGGSEGIAPLFLMTSALDGGEWSVSRPGRFTPEERVLDTHYLESLVGPQSRSGRYGEEKDHTPAGQAVAPRYKDWAIPALLIWYNLLKIFILNYKGRTHCKLQSIPLLYTMFVVHYDTTFRSYYYPIWDMSTGLYTASDTKIWLWCQRGPEPKITALAKPSRNLHDQPQSVYKDFREQRIKSAFLLQTSSPANFVLTPYLGNVNL
jgi:hypothetical protein